ncbi:hypothetical protein BDAP_001045 [Binucleata daphniae]
MDLDSLHNRKLTKMTETIKISHKKHNKNYHYYGIFIEHMNKVIDMKQKLDKKCLESNIQCIEDYVNYKKKILNDIEPGTLKNLADIQIKKNMISRKDIFYSILDDIIETKHEIVVTEALVYKILNEMKKKE